MRTGQAGGEPGRWRLPACLPCSPVAMRFPRVPAMHAVAGEVRSAMLSPISAIASQLRPQLALLLPPPQVKPRKGDALLFHSIKPNGELERRSMHGACPVIKVRLAAAQQAPGCLLAVPAAAARCRRSWPRPLSGSLPPPCNALPMLLPCRGPSGR